MKKQPWLLALMASGALGFVSLQAHSFFLSRNLDRVDYRVDSTDGVACVDLTYRGRDSQENALGIRRWSASLAAHDPSCIPSDGTECTFDLTSLNLYVEGFKAFGAPIRKLRISLKEPVQVTDSGDGIVIPDDTLFVAKGSVGDLPDTLELRPTDRNSAAAEEEWQRLNDEYEQAVEDGDEDAVKPPPLGDLYKLRLTLNYDAGSAMLEGSLEGAGKDGAGKLVQMSVVVSATDAKLDNRPPKANAGPDQSLATSCTVPVQLTSRSSDPDDNLEHEYFSLSTNPLIDGQGEVSLFPGEYVFDHLAVDRYASVALDRVSIDIADEGEIVKPAASQLVTLRVPAEADYEKIVLAAGDQLKLSDRVRVSGPNGELAQVVNFSEQDGIRSYFHADSVVNADVWSRPQAWLLERADIKGSLWTTVQPERQNNTQVGELIYPYDFSASNDFSFVVQPAVDRQYVGHREPDTFLALEPGNYDWVSLKRAATLELSAGFYRFSQFWMEPGSSLVLTGDEPTYILVDETATFRGAATSEAGGGLLVVNLGSQETIVTSPFEGTVVAPLAKLTLNSSNQTKHTGAFFGKNIQVDSDAVIEHAPAQLEALEIERRACALTPLVKCVDETDSGLVAHFTYTNDATVTPVRVNFGLGNRVSPGPTDQGQPEGFRPGRLPAEAFTASFASDGSLTWYLGAKHATADASSPRCN